MFVHRLSLQLLLGCMIIASAACSDLGSEAGHVVATADGTFLLLTNLTGDMVYYFIVPKKVAPFIDWIPCNDPETCRNKVPPGKTVRLSYNQVFEGFFERDDKVIVYWWRLLRRPDNTYKTDSINSIEVEL